MPSNLDALSSFLSQFTGEQIDAAVYYYLSNAVLSFNNRSGPTVNPEAGDYSDEQISLSTPFSIEGVDLSSVKDLLFALIDQINSSCPLGTIVSFMGTIPPANYLICDGTEYDIEDYPQLASFFDEQFDSVNFFGGDGTTTFAVPDLRGEFLRGSGTNSHVDSSINVAQGSGESVGGHQNATVIPMIQTSGTTNFGLGTSIQSGGNPLVRNQDNTWSGTSHAWKLFGGSNQTGMAMPEHNLVRPTNTSVNFIIRAKIIAI